MFELSSMWNNCYLKTRELDGFMFEQTYENAEVGKGIEKTFAAYTRSVLHAQYNVDPVGVITYSVPEQCRPGRCYNRLSDAYTRSVLKIHHG